MSNGPDVSNNQDLTPEQKKGYVARMKAAWKALPDEQRKALQPLLDTAHQQFGDFVRSRKPPDHKYHSILRMESYLNDDADKYLENLDAAVAKEIVLGLGPEGQIYGIGKYQELDPCWELVAGTVWLENLLNKHHFPPGTPTRKPMPDDGRVRIALAGDFGTGNFGADDSPSTKISKIMASLQPHITVHLGDVYYAGTSGEESSKLMNYWPRGSIGSFTLNSNHEMYSGGGPYFNEAVGGPMFNKLQSPWSFFALENANWVVVGLDSAYNAGELDLYMDGSLGKNAQVLFLRKLAEDKTRKMILLTHHNGFDLGGYVQSAESELLQQVTAAFDGGAPAYWYWGHKHAGAVYKPLPKYKNMLCRCAGHSALPWGLSTELQAGKNAGQVEWFEDMNAGDPYDKLRVFNGCVLLELDGENLFETFYDEKGRIAWSNGKVYYRG